MNLLFLCGVDDAGKSMTLRYSVQHLNTSAKTKKDFINSRDPTNNKQNPPKVVVVNGKKIYMALCSPQELEDEKRGAKEILMERLTAANRNTVDLFVLPLNIDYQYDQSIDDCLNYLDHVGLKPVSNFVYLDSITSADKFARQKINQMRTDGYSIMGTIQRQSGPEIAEYNRRGRIFATFINQLI